MVTRLKIVLKESLVTYVMSYSMQATMNIPYLQLTLNMQGLSYLGLTRSLNIMAADALAPYVIRTSAAMILILWNM